MKGGHPKHRLTGYHEFFTRNIKRGESIVDIGCGMGTVAFDVALAGAGFVLGIDMNRNSIDVAIKM